MLICRGYGCDGMATPAARPRCWPRSRCWPGKLRGWRLAFAQCWIAAVKELKISCPTIGVYIK